MVEQVLVLSRWYCCSFISLRVGILMKSIIVFGASHSWFMPLLVVLFICAERLV